MLTERKIALARSFVSEFTVNPTGKGWLFTSKPDFVGWGECEAPALKSGRSADASKKKFFTYKVKKEKVTGVLVTYEKLWTPRLAF